MYEIIAQQRPFAGVDAAVLPGIVREGKRPALPVLVEERLAAVPEGAALLALVALCWVPRPAARPRFRFLEHQLLTLCDNLQAEAQQQHTLPIARLQAPAAASVSAAGAAPTAAAP